MENTNTEFFALDLGGSGLKVACVSLENGKPKILEKPQTRGRCPEQTIDALKKWILQILCDSIDNNKRIAFSLAGTNKFWCDGVTTVTPPDNMDFLKIKCSEIHDAEAHLLAALRTSSAYQHPVICFSIGSGIGFACTNSKGEMRRVGSFKKNFGMEPWELRYDSKDIWESLSGRQLDELKKNMLLTEAVTALQEKWNKFIVNDFLPLYEGNENKYGWTRPKTVFLTGGVVDHNESFLPSVNVVSILRGPKDAGLLGAVYNAIEPPKWDQ